MTGEHIAGLAARYNGELRKAGITPREDGEPLEHVGWMCDEIRGFVRAREYAKANRWLGFVQGVLYTRGVYSVTTMRVHNRSPDEQKVARSRMTEELRTTLDVAVFPGTNVFVGGHADETVTVATAQPDGTFRKHWLQLVEVKEVHSPDAT